MIQCSGCGNYFDRIVKFCKECYELYDDEEREYLAQEREGIEND